MKVTYHVGRFGRTFYCAECSKRINSEEWKGEHDSKWVLHHPKNQCSFSDQFFTEPKFYAELIPESQSPTIFKIQRKEAFSSKHEMLWVLLMLLGIITVVFGVISLLLFLSAK